MEFIMAILLFMAMEFMVLDYHKPSKLTNFHMERNQRTHSQFQLEHIQLFFQIL